MFGYVTPDKAELKMRQYSRYRAFYCGLCRTIGQRYSEKARLTLNYDCAFFALALNNVMGAARCSLKRCAYKPIEKPRMMIEQNAAMDFAADMNLALAYNKLADDKRDEHGVKRVSATLGRGMLTGDYKKAKANSPLLCEKIEEGIMELCAIENAGCEDIDAPADAFATLMANAAICAPIEDRLKRKAFAAMCAGLGRWIYLIDAWEDRASDEKTGAYNAFVLAKADSERAGVMLYNSLFEAQQAYMLLRPLDDGEIVENILIDGCAARTRRVLGGYDDKPL